MNFRKITLSVFVLSLLLCATSSWAQSSGSIEGVVKDSSGGVLSNATVEISNPVTGFHRETATGSGGDFRITNLPFNPYRVAVTAKGFSTYTHDVDVRSVVPTTLDVSLKLGTTSENITGRGDWRGTPGNRIDPSHRRGSRTFRQVATREPVVFT